MVPLLQQGVPYREIHELTGVSVTTTGRVARSLEHGHGGYTAAIAVTATPTPPNPSKRASPMSATQNAPARDRLRIAIQKNGRLAEPARSLLTACGLSWRQSRDKLFCYGESLPVDLLLVRDDDIPGLIADGVCDFGIVGRNELDEQGAARRRIGLPDAYQALRGLNFGQCRLMLAVPDEWEWTGVEQLAGKRIATSYPAILADWLAARGVDAQVVELSGRWKSRRAWAPPT